MKLALPVESPIKTEIASLLVPKENLFQYGIKVVIAPVTSAVGAAKIMVGSEVVDGEPKAILQTKYSPPEFFKKRYSSIRATYSTPMACVP